MMEAILWTMIAEKFSQLIKVIHTVASNTYFNTLKNNIKCKKKILSACKGGKIHVIIKRIKINS